MITDEGFLNNPYRSYRFVNPSDDRLFALAREIYPRTRTSNAVALNARYFLPYRAAVHGGYRFFTDTWGIGADTFELGYTHPMGTVDFEAATATTRRATPTSTATCSSARTSRTSWRATRSCRRSTARRSASARPTSSRANGWRFVKKGTLNLFYDRIEFDYEDFRDARFSLLPADDPNFRAAGSRAAVHLRRQRLPGVRVGLVLKKRSRIADGGQSAACALLLISPLAARRSLSRPAI